MIVFSYFTHDDIINPPIMSTFISMSNTKLKMNRYSF